MKYYFIDIENVGLSGFNGIEKLTKDDVVIMFVYENQTLPNALTKLMRQSNARFEIKTYSLHTKNAADFCIVSYLGYLLAKHPNDEFYVISKDNGYQVALECLRNVHPNATILQMKPNIENKFLLLSREKRRNMMRESLSSLQSSFATPTAFERVVNICAKYSTLSEVNSGLMHSFKKNEYGEIYEKIKPYYEEVLKTI